MSIFEQATSYRATGEHFAATAVQELQTGAALHDVRITMELAAEYRHLAYELTDTWEIARQARAEYLEAVA